MITLSRRWPVRGLAGLLLIAICWPLNWTLPGVGTSFLFFPLDKNITKPQTASPTSGGNGFSIGGYAIRRTHLEHVARAVVRSESLAESSLTSRR